MNRLYVRLYGNLNQLVEQKYQTSFVYTFLLDTTLKDVIESIGIPHTEIGLILLDNKSVGWKTKVRDKARVSFFPLFYSFDVSKISKVYVKLPKLKFICDVHLGKLAKYLRIMGFDCLYENNYKDEEIIKIGTSERRIILTMDRGILKNSKVKYGALIRSKNLRDQLRELDERFNIGKNKKLLSRCILCNKKLKPTTRKKATKKFAYLNDKFYSGFFYCSHCDKIYYKGSHYKKMLDYLENLF
ncbi:MAG: Mut7-C ubiquitin/RNAse domain-containing protein [Brevinematales bacterium]|nr:Mut7-C ubiquitin/RNAse domain-containing protein [Brevinematales bacterium]